MMRYPSFLCLLVTLSSAASLAAQTPSVVIEQPSALHLRLAAPENPVISLGESRLALNLPNTEWLELDMPSVDGNPEQAPRLDPQPTLRLTFPAAEGNYRVRITTKPDSGRLVVWSEARRLMAIADAPGRAGVECIVNVRHRALPPPPQNAPGGMEVRTNEREVGAVSWDDNLNLALTGDFRAVTGITLEPVEVPTVFLAGDSTVNDMRSGDYASWGQMLPLLFRPEVAIANHAESGETLKSYLTGLRLDKILSLARPGDYLFIQFGHNDSKEGWPQTYAEAGTTYRAYLEAYIAEAKRRGMHVVLVTSMHRRRFDNAGKIIDTHGAYPKAVREVAHENELPLVDLHAMSAPLYEALGVEGSSVAFANQGKDGTHHSAYGAYVLARCVAQALRDAGVPLAEKLQPTVDAFDPAHPGDAGTFLRSDWVDPTVAKPAGN